MLEGEPEILITGKNHYEFGVKVGERYRKFLSSCLLLLGRGKPQALSKKHLKLLNSQIPEFREELEGVSRGSGIEVDELLLIRRLLASSITFGCTNFGARGKATEDGGVMLSWNFDALPLMKLLLGSFPFFVREIEGKIPYLCFGVPALFGIGILNAEQLACVVNAVGIEDDGEGLSPFELNNLAMETCSDVSGAEAIFREGPRQATRSMVFGLLMNWNTIWADRSGDLAVFEYSHNHFRSQRAGEDEIIASANHHQFLDRSLSGSFDPTTQEIIGGSYSRLGRMWSLLRENHGRISPSVAKTMVSDHIPDYALLREFGIEKEWWEEKIDDSTICAHPWNARKHLKKGDIEGALLETSFSWTLYSMQIQPHLGTVWFSNGNPCRAASVPVFWGKMLGMDDLDKPAGFVLPTEFGKAKSSNRRSGLFLESSGALEKTIESLWFRMIEQVERRSFEKIGK